MSARPSPRRSRPRPRPAASTTPLPHRPAATQPLPRSGRGPPLSCRSSAAPPRGSSIENVDLVLTAVHNAPAGRMPSFATTDRDATFAGR